jgi:uncharacterized repeat protein (TIGR03803 family)
MMAKTFNSRGRARTRIGIAAALGMLAASLGAAASASTFTPLYWFKTDSPTQGQVWAALSYRDNTLYCAVLSGQGTIFQLTPPPSGNGGWISRILHRFDGTDGDSPYGALLLDPADQTKPVQHIFGTTEYPGGNVFELTAPVATSKPWGLSVLHTFSEFTTPDRANMFSGVIADRLVKGRLFGVAPLGGPKSYGTVFALTPPAKTGGDWTVAVLAEFDITNGMTPEGGLLQDTDGTLYGTTKAGGAHYYGTVFQLTPPAAGVKKWTLRTLYTFTGNTDGGFPASSLIFDASHKHIFGVGSIAVTGQQGTVYRLTRPAASGGKWVYTQIHTFKADGVDGGQENGDEGPGSAVVMDKQGNLYGTTQSGGANYAGTVYKLTNPKTENGVWAESILHAFAQKDGINPYAALVMGANGELYGTTTDGGPSGKMGGVFRVVP